MARKPAGDRKVGTVATRLTLADLRREFKCRGLACDNALVPDDVIEGRMNRDRVRPAKIAGWPAAS